MYYTTHEVANKMPNYGSARTLLEALHNNQKGLTNSPLLKEVWKCKKRFGKHWGFMKDEIDLILKGK